MIQTARLTLRPYEPHDNDALAALLMDPEVMSFWPRPLTRAEARAWLERCRALYLSFGWCRLAVLEGGTLIGDVGLARIALDGESLIDLGWILARSHWGRGLATEAAMAVRDHAFGRLGMSVLHANMPVTHAASRHVAERIGMKPLRRFANPRNGGAMTDLYQIVREDIPCL